VKGRPRRLWRDGFETGIDIKVARSVRIGEYLAERYEGEIVRQVTGGYLSV
jgi:hypothetical protein